MSMSEREQWQQLYEKYQRDLLEQSEIIAKLRAENAEMGAMIAQMTEIAEQTVPALRKQNTAMREIVQAVADARDLGECLFPGCKEHVYIRHHGPDCPVTKARTLLSAE